MFGKIMNYDKIDAKELGQSLKGFYLMQETMRH